MVRVEYTHLYRRGLQNLLKDDPALQLVIERHIQLFRINPNDTRLANHALHKRLSDKWAFSVTDDIRIIYRWIGKKTARFFAIGTHEAVCKKN